MNGAGDSSEEAAELSPADRALAEQARQARRELKRERKTKKEEARRAPSVKLEERADVDADADAAGLGLKVVLSVQVDKELADRSDSYRQMRARVTMGTANSISNQSLGMAHVRRAA